MLDCHPFFKQTHEQQSWPNIKLRLGDKTLIHRKTYAKCHIPIDGDMEFETLRVHDNNENRMKEVLWFSHHLHISLVRV